ncbi:hypothetical protein BIZ50_03360 [Helicobacter pylori]|nr:hypothetical protein BIZ44_04475 [Helicobacter pylori]OLR47632.1 hypothetical protein BIZ50_03360 [Helicobacter pylori]
MNASVKGLLALLLIIQTNKGSKTLHFKLPQPKEENLIGSLVKAFLNQLGWTSSLFYFFNL